MWTRFMDMHSGGGTKEKPYDYIYIEEDEDTAIRVFYNRFGHNPHRVTCTCCGNDYSIDEWETLEQATAYDRNCDFDRESKKYVEQKGKYGKYHSLSDYLLIAKDVLIIKKEEIKPEERTGTVPK